MQKKSNVSDIEILAYLPVSVDILLLKDQFSSYKNAKKKIFDLCHKGYLNPIRQGLYFNLKSNEINNFKNEIVANSLYFPSYVSLEWALQYYGLIPEKVMQVTSVTTRSSKLFKTPLVEFSYAHLYKKRYSVGYLLCDGFLIARPEKALIDYINLKAKNLVIQSSDDVRSFLQDDLRIHLMDLMKLITVPDLQELLPYYHRNSKEHRILKWLLAKKEKD